MGYENRLPPEGINVTQVSLAKQLTALLTGMGIFIALCVVGLYLLGSLLASHVPFAWEVSIAQNIGLYKDNPDPRSKTLQALADRLAKHANLPAGMTFSVHYVDDDEVNAYATLGGVINMHGGLIKQLHSENAVAMVLAHEMAHVMHRDVATAMGGRLTVSLALTLASAMTGLDLLDKFAGMTSNLTLLSFSREAEHQADIAGVAMVGRAYGHVGGVTEVFERLATYEAKVGVNVPEFMASHPETIGRNETLREQAQKMGIPLDGTLTPLPVRLRSGQK